MQKKKRRNNSSHTKTVFRTIFYQFLIIFIAVSIGFLSAPVYWGNRAPVINRSVEHIFFPIEYNDTVENFLLNIGRKRLYYETIIQHGNKLPDLFEIVKDSEWIEGEERYHCEYQYVDKDGTLDVHKYTTRIKWKPWEFYFPSPKDLELE